MEARKLLDDAIMSVIVKNTKGDSKSPVTVLKELLYEFTQKLDNARPQQSSPCSLFPLSFEDQLAGELMSAVKANSPHDPLSIAVLRLNTLNKTHLASKQNKDCHLARVLTAFFSVYEHCAQQLDDAVVEGLLTLENVWPQYIQKLIQLVLDDAQTGSELVKKMSFETLARVSYIPEKMRTPLTQAILTQINTTKMGMSPNPTLYKIAVECMITLKDYIAVDIREQLLDILILNSGHDNQVIRNAASNALVQCRDWLMSTRKVMNVDSYLEIIRSAESIWLIKKACMVLGNLAPIISEQKLGVVVEALLKSIKHENEEIRQLAIVALGRLSANIPHDKHKDVIHCLFACLNDKAISVCIEAYTSLGLLKKILSLSSYPDYMAMVQATIQPAIPEGADEKTTNEIKHAQTRIQALEMTAQLIEGMTALSCTIYIDEVVKILGDKTEADVLRAAACKVILQLAPRMFYEQKEAALIQLSEIIRKNELTNSSRFVAVDAYVALHQTRDVTYYDAEMAEHLLSIIGEIKQPVNMRMAAMKAACIMASRASCPKAQLKLVNQLLHLIVDMHERKAVKLQTCKLVCQLEFTQIDEHMTTLVVSLLRKMKNKVDARMRANNVDILRCLAKRVPEHLYREVIGCLLEAMHDKERSVKVKAYTAVQAYLDYMDNNERMVALSRLYVCAAQEKNDHHKSKLVLIDVYLKHWQALAAARLLRAQPKDKDNNTFSIDLPIEMTKSIMRYAI